MGLSIKAFVLLEIKYYEAQLEMAQISDDKGSPDYWGDVGALDALRRVLEAIEEAGS